MSIWGKVIGGAAGFALGGPLGALVGALAGHAVDRMQQTGAQAIPGAEDATGAAGIGGETRKIAFTIAVIALGAKMAKADGVVTRAEVDAFKRIFHVPPGEIGNVSRVFNQARRDARGFEPYARQIAKLFRGQPAVLEELLCALFHIALADGEYHPAEQEFLRKVGEIFGITGAGFERVEAEQTGRAGSDPYTVLGIDRSVSDEEARQAFRALIREHHPDRLMAEGMPQEFVDLANERMAHINVAWDRVREERGIK